MSARKVLGSLLFAAALAAGSEAHAQGAPAAPRIGVFDAQRLSEETTEGKRVQADLTALSEEGGEFGSVTKINLVQSLLSGAAGRR